MAPESRGMQCSVLTEEKQKNQFAQTEFRFINTITIIVIIIIIGAITSMASHEHRKHLRSRGPEQAQGHLSALQRRGPQQPAVICERREAVARGACSTARCILHPNTRQHNTHFDGLDSWMHGGHLQHKQAREPQRLSRGMRGEKQRTSTSPWAASTAAGAAGIACSNVKCNTGAITNIQTHKQTCSI